MPGFGWRYPLVDRGWPDVRSLLAAVEWRRGGDDYPLQIADFVLAHGADEVLAVATSIHDLIVVPKPVGDPPLDAVAVRVPGSLRSHRRGTVLIEHLAGTGRNTEIERPADEAVALFWRFMEVEFGIRPTGQL